MAYYENHSDMFKQRAEKSRKAAEQFQVKAKQAKDCGDTEKYKKYTDQAKAYYQSEKDNLASAKANAGKSW